MVSMKNFFLNILNSQKLILIALVIVAMIAFQYAFIQPSMAGDEGTVDELFELFIEKWVKPVAQPDAEYAEVKNDFLGELKSARTHFGHLPEYWELRAHVDLREEDLARDVREVDFLEFDIQHDYYLRLNPKMLKRALILDPERPAVLWNLGRIKALDAWPGWHDIDYSERRDATPEEYIRYYADGLAEAGEADPDNGYYPFFEAPKRARLGDSETALELFEIAIQCERFHHPALFPASYALEVVDDFKECTGIFEGMSQLERDYLGAHFYFPSIVEDIPELRDSFRYIIDNHKDNWRETFNILNSTACRLGKNDWGHPIYQITATLLVKICRDEALAIAEETGDKELEIALLALWHEAENIRTGFKIERSVQDRTYMLMRPVLEELFEFKVDPSNEGTFADFTRYMQQGPYSVEDLDWADRWLTDMMTGVVDIIREAEFSNKHIWHIFERIEKFDYEDPLWWYVWWEMEGRYSPAKDDESYRESCWT